MIESRSGRLAVGYERFRFSEGKPEELALRAFSIVYPVFVTALKAHVVNGRIVVDEAVDLPDGSEVRVYCTTRRPKA